MKDNFSDNSSYYARYRPHYPNELFEFLYSKVDRYDKAWDCGTGNGQVAVVLAEKFSNVFASDISENQLRQAVRKENINYILCSAEHTLFPDNTFDLITVAQAIHWFNFNAFYKEILRIAKKDALLAVWGYGLVSINEQIDKVIKQFYQERVGKYWDEERKYIDERYTTIPFPFEELPPKSFEIVIQWNLHHFINYIGTWSSVKKYKQAEKTDPVIDLLADLKQIWPEEELHPITFPVFMRLGKVLK